MEIYKLNDAQWDEFARLLESEMDEEKMERLRLRMEEASPWDAPDDSEHRFAAPAPEGYSIGSDSMTWKLEAENDAEALEKFKATSIGEGCAFALYKDGEYFAGWSGGQSDPEYTYNLAGKEVTEDEEPGIDRIGEEYEYKFGEWRL
jgi:hypothetical protein